MRTVLDEEVLQFCGGVINNSLTNKVNIDVDDLQFQFETLNHQPYYETDGFISLLKSNPKNFTILSSNIESVHSQINEFEIFLLFNCSPHSLNSFLIALFQAIYMLCCMWKIIDCIQPIGHCLQQMPNQQEPVITTYNT